MRFRPWTGAPSAKHFEQCAEFALLRNCSFRALAGMVLAIPFARRPVNPLRPHRTRGREDEQRLTADMIELARQYGRYGYRKVAALLRLSLIVQPAWRAFDKSI